MPITPICDGQSLDLAFDATTAQGRYSDGGLVVPNCMGEIKPVTCEPKEPIMPVDDPQTPADAKRMLLKHQGDQYSTRKDRDRRPASV